MEDESFPAGPEAPPAEPPFAAPPPATLLAPPGTTPAPPEPYPFWSYADLVVFFGLAFPCLLLGGFLLTRSASTRVAGVRLAR